MILRFDRTQIGHAERRSGGLNGTSGRVAATLMPMEGYRSGDSLVMHIDLLGAAPETVALTLDEGRLMLNAQAPEDGQGLMPANQPLQATLRQEFSLGRSLDHEHIEARFTEGVLTITVPFT